MCEWALVSRASCYRNWEQKAPGEAETALRDAVQKAALKHRGCGYRRVAAWLAIRRRKFIATTDSDHPFRAHPNLAESLELTGIDQLWGADITYIRLLQEFVFLAVVWDAYSRKAIGWQWGRNLDTSLPLGALEAAIASRHPRPGLVHHSDRGTQYASNQYVKRWEDCGAHISMSRPARPWETGACESFMKTLKREESNARRYRSFGQLQAHVEEFMDQIYNRVRLHSALNYRSRWNSNTRWAKPKRSGHPRH